MPAKKRGPRSPPEGQVKAVNDPAFQRPGGADLSHNESNACEGKECRLIVAIGADPEGILIIVGLSADQIYSMTEGDLLTAQPAVGPRLMIGRAENPEDLSALLAKFGLVDESTAVLFMLGGVGGVGGGE